MEQEKIIDEIRAESTKLQTDFMISLINLCDKYRVKKTAFIRDTVSELYKLVQTSNFDSFEVKK